MCVPVRVRVCVYTQAPHTHTSALAFGKLGAAAWVLDQKPGVGDEGGASAREEMAKALYRAKGGPGQGWEGFR